jgi:hypothetical protein
MGLHGLLTGTAVTTYNVSETDPVSETLCSSVFLEYRTMDKVQKPSSPELAIEFIKITLGTVCGYSLKASFLQDFISSYLIHAYIRAVCY